MGKLSSKMLIPITTAIMAIVFIYLGITKYGIWNAEKGPLGGFFPVIMACALLLVSCLAMIQAKKESKAVFDKSSFLPMLGALLVIIGSQIIGMLISLLIYIVVWLKVVEKSTWKVTLIVTAVLSTIVYGVFVLWLNVPFPKGILIKMILG